MIESASLAEVLALSPYFCRDQQLTPADIRRIFEVLNAGWTYQGDPSPDRPHAVLTSGKCSNGYFNCRRVLCHPNLCEILAVQAVKKMKALGKPDGVDWVIGSPYSAITWSYELARALRASHAFVEKDPADPKKMVWKEEIPEGAIVLQGEELITTLGTTIEVASAITGRNTHPVKFLPFVVALVHRPAAERELNPDRVVSLLGTVVEAWDTPDECPYCQVGSPRVQPKTEWARLVGSSAA